MSDKPKTYTLTAELDEEAHAKALELVELLGGDLTKAMRIAFHLAHVVAKHTLVDGATLILRGKDGHEQEITLT